jgi:hypothetical protein
MMFQHHQYRMIIIEKNINRQVLIKDDELDVNVRVDMMIMSIVQAIVRILCFNKKK